MTALWIALAALAAYAIGRQRGWVRGRRHGIAEAGQWEALCDELDDDLRKAEHTIKVLNHNIDTAFKAGTIAGQMFQAERQEHDL